MAAVTPCGCRVELQRFSFDPPRIVYCISHAHISERGTMRACGCYCSPDLTDGGCVWEVEWCHLHAAAPALLDALREMEATFRVPAGTDTTREVAALSLARAAIRRATEGKD